MYNPPPPGPRVSVGAWLGAGRDPARSDSLVRANVLVPREPALLGPGAELSSQAHDLAQKLYHPYV